MPDFCLKILIFLGSDPDFNIFFRVGSLHFRPFCKGTPQICTAYHVPDIPSSVCVLQCAALERSHINIKVHVIQMKCIKPTISNTHQILWHVLIPTTRTSTCTFIYMSKHCTPLHLTYCNAYIVVHIVSMKVYALQYKVMLDT